MLSAESHLSLLDSVVRSAVGLCEGEPYCLGAQKEGQCLVRVLVRFIAERTALLHEYLHHFVEARDNIASAALCELALVILLSRTD